MKSLETRNDDSGFSTYERRQQVARILSRQQRVSVAELSKALLVSEVTIRKDLAWLEERHLLVRTHGGAVLAKKDSSEQAFDVRERQHHTEKEQIGRLAARLVQNGDAIALDASTTALSMVRFLNERHELTVITNGLQIGMELIKAPNVSVLMPGGMLRQNAFSLVGTWGKSILQQINISTAFVSARGLTLNEGLTEVDSEEAVFKRALVESARQVVAIVDHSKWGHIAFTTFCNLDALKLIITDAKAPEAQVQQVRKAGIEVWIADDYL